MFYIDSKATRKDLGCFHHKEIINICRDGYALSNFSKTHHTYIWPRWDPINANFTYSGICLKVIWILKNIQLPSPSHFNPVTMACLLGTYLSPGLVLRTILNLQMGGVFPMGPIMAGSSSVLEKVQLLLSLFSVFLTHPRSRPPLPAMKASATDTKVCVRLSQFQQAWAWKGCVLRSCIVYQATLKSLPPTRLVSEQTACSYSERAQT